MTASSIAPSWWLYIIQCSDGSLYTGITNHLINRWHKHNNGEGAKYFRSHQPQQVVYLEYPHTRSSASRRENQIKQFSKLKKQQLIASFTNCYEC